jgi:hypothetical protein
MCAAGEADSLRNLDDSRRPAGERRGGPSMPAGKPGNFAPPTSTATGTGSFRRAAGSTFAVGRGPWSVAIGDVNRDGKTDVVTANGDDDSVSILLAR